MSTRSILKERLSERGAKSQFARSVGIKPQNLTTFLTTYKGFRKGRAVKRIEAEMQKRGWLGPDKVDQEGLASIGFTSTLVSPQSVAITREKSVKRKYQKQSINLRAELRKVNEQLEKLQKRKAALSILLSA